MIDADLAHVIAAAAAIETAFGDASNVRVFAGPLPAPAQLPAIVVHLVSDQPVYSLSGAELHRTARLQVDCLGLGDTGRAFADAAAAAVRTIGSGVARASWRTTEVLSCLVDRTRVDAAADDPVRIAVSLDLVAHYRA